MMKMNRILAAIDFSEVSDAVLEHAASIAEAFSAHLVLLHVAAPDPDFVGLDAGPQTVRDARAKELRDEHRQLQERAGAFRERGIEAEAFLVQGPTVDTILERAEHLEVDLLVLGSHGHGLAYRALLGSVSEGVLHRAVAPVLIVPQRSGSAKQR
jgi:nucleotide-binding universal stress UspA family protein